MRSSNCLIWPDPCDPVWEWGFYFYKQWFYYSESLSVLNLYIICVFLMSIFLQCKDVCDCFGIFLWNWKMVLKMVWKMANQSLGLGSSSMSNVVVYYFSIFCLECSPHWSDEFTINIGFINLGFGGYYYGKWSYLHFIILSELLVWYC